jgi:hypothetical protein
MSYTGSTVARFIQIGIFQRTNSIQIGLIASSFNELPAHRIYIAVTRFIQIGIFQRSNSIQIG